MELLIRPKIRLLSGCGSRLPLPVLVNLPDVGPISASDPETGSFHGITAVKNVSMISAVNGQKPNIMRQKHTETVLQLCTDSGVKIPALRVIIKTLALSSPIPPGVTSVIAPSSGNVTYDPNNYWFQGDPIDLITAVNAAVEYHGQLII